ncbi:MAG: diphthamide biosynthesis enzyme Dph2 [Thermoplasmata archaeon]
MILSGYRFDTENLRKELKEMGVRKALLQVPDGLRYKSKELVNEFDVDTEIWGGSCYGACDLPASIDDADVLIHVGHSEIPNLKPNYPVIYVEAWNTAKYDVPDDFVEMFTGKKIAVYSTVQYMEQRDKMADILEENDAEVTMGRGDERIKHPGQVLGCNFSSRCEADEHIFIGTGSFHPVGLSLSLNKSVHVFDPVMERYYTTEKMLDRLLRKRFASITLAEEKESFAIIVSDKIGQERYGLAADLKDECDLCAVVHMNEISPDKIDSLGFDVAVNTACPRLALDDSIRFKTIMLTPCEFRIARKELEWDEWKMDEID